MLPHIIIHLKRNDVRGLSLPRPLVWLPIPLKADTNGWHNALGWVGSSQHKGIVVLAKSEPTNSAEDCDTRCIPIIWLMIRNAVGFPLAVSRMAVETGQEPIYLKNFRLFLRNWACIFAKRDRCHCFISTWMSFEWTCCKYFDIYDLFWLLNTTFVYFYYFTPANARRFYSSMGGSRKSGVKGLSVIKIINYLKILLNDFSCSNS